MTPMVGTLGSVCSGPVWIPAPQLSGFPHLAGLPVIESQPWNVIQPTGWSFDFGTTSSNFTINQDATAPVSPPNVIAGIFAAGDPGGSAPFTIFRSLPTSPSPTTLGLGIAMMHSANFDNTNGNYETKYMWPACDQIEGSDTYMTFQSPNMNFGITQQNTVNREMYSNVGSPSVASMVNYLGQWVIYELILKVASTLGGSDGAFDIWINGNHTHHYTDVTWAGNSWLSLSWSPTYGGGPNPVPHTQYEFIDHLLIAGQ